MAETKTKSKVTEKILTEQQKQTKAKKAAIKEAREAAQANGTYTSLKDKRQEAKNNAELDKAEQKMVAEPPVDEGINIKQNELAEEQKTINEMKAPASTVDTSTPDTNTPDVAAQLGLDNNTLSNAMSGDQNARDTIDVNMNEASKSIFEVDEKGYAKPMSKMTFAEGWEKIAPIATVLSGIIFALSGGAFPPINFSKLTGLDDRYQSYLNLCEEQNKLTMGASAKNTAEGIRAGQDVETANAAANIENAQDKDLLAFKDKLDTNSKITLSKLAHEQQKEIMELAAKQDAEALGRKLRELLDQGFSREEITSLATVLASQMGITPNQLAAITFDKFAQPVTNAANTVVNAVKPGCDKRIKDFFKFKK